MTVILEWLLCIAMIFWNHIGIKIGVFGFVSGRVCKANGLSAVHLLENQKMRVPFPCVLSRLPAVIHSYLPVSFSKQLWNDENSSLDLSLWAVGSWRKWEEVLAKPPKQDLTVSGPEVKQKSLCLLIIPIVPYPYVKSKNKEIAQISNQHV